MNENIIIFSITLELQRRYP